MTKTIGVAIICKNEEAMIERCLDSVQGFDQYVVVDTGSQDRTIEILRNRGIEPDLGFIWIDDFAAAQNYAKSKLTTDWVLSIDCDEQLLSTPEEVYEAVEKAKDTVRVIMQAEGGVQNDFGFPRIFRNSEDIYWVASIHKHLNIAGEGEDVGEVRMMYGYSPAHQLDPDRSLRMLEHTVATEENPVRNLYYLAREYWYKQRFQDCIDTVNRYIPVSHWESELADALLIKSQAHFELSQVEEAKMSCLQAISVNSDFKEAIQWMAQISTKENAPQWLRMAKTANNRDLIWKRVPVERNPNVIALIPHNDDEALFLAYTLIREKPLVIVITDSYIQPERGDEGCDYVTRRKETLAAMELAGCPVVFLGIKDTELEERDLIIRLQSLNPEKVYAPAVQGGNPQHDLVGRVAKKVFGEIVQYYTTYTRTELYTTGSTEVKPTPEERALKFDMMRCYKSQIKLASTNPHFGAVSGKSEWFLKPLTKVIITPYFGDFPEWMDKFEPPNGYTWILDRDLEGFKKRVKDKLGIDYPGVYGSPKVWDYRCALGLLYEEEIKGFDYWGHMDFDMVFGDVDKFLPDSHLANCTIYSGHNEYVCGCFSLYKNVPEVNNLFKQFPDWKEKMIHPEPNGWVEQEFSREVEKTMNWVYSFDQGNPWDKNPKIKKENGKLYQSPDGEHWNEIMFFHFRHSKKWPL